MIDPQYALIECRWEKDPQEATAIRELGGKLDTRPSIVAGLYVSMSGFTDGARTIAQQMHERAVVLMNRDDILALAEGMMTFQAFWRERMRELVVRYPK
jgi:restriction endonuclease Mrr